jgi:hypothetical protein
LAQFRHKASRGVCDSCQWDFLATNSSAPGK